MSLKAFWSHTFGCSSCLIHSAAGMQQQPSTKLSAGSSHPRSYGDGSGKAWSAARAGNSWTC
eukprot:1158060-Pelagomonas_calceolata.AAC.6